MKTVKDQFVQLVENHLGVDPKTIQLESKLVEDLGADSLDLVGLLMNVEEHFDISITDDEASAISTVQDVINLLVSKGAKGQ